MSSWTIQIDGPIRGKGRHRTRVTPGFAGSAPKQTNYTPDRTANAENYVKWCAISQIGHLMLTGPIKISIAVIVEIPGSWSAIKKRKAADGLFRPTGKPDFDNVAKMLCDALNKIVWKDDAQIVSAEFGKHYGEKPGAIITVWAL